MFDFQKLYTFNEGIYYVVSGIIVWLNNIPLNSDFFFKFDINLPI